MLKTIKLQSTMGRGRNGWFNAVSVSLHHYSPGINITAPCSVDLCFWSRQVGEMAPILVEMTPDDMICLADEMKAWAVDTKARLERGETL